MKPWFESMPARAASPPGRLPRQGGFPANKVSQVRALIDPITAE